MLRLNPIATTTRHALSLTLFKALLIGSGLVLLCSTAPGQISAIDERAEGFNSSRAYSNESDRETFSDNNLRGRASGLITSDSQNVGGRPYAASADLYFDYSYDLTASSAVARFSASSSTSASGYGANGGQTSISTGITHRFRFTLAQPMVFTLTINLLQSTSGSTLMVLGNGSTNTFRFDVDDGTAGPDVATTHEYLLPRGSYSFLADFDVLNDPRSTPPNGTWQYTQVAGMDYEFTIRPVPEPSTLALLVGAAFCALRSRKCLRS